jgi:hypothetical protein
MALMKYSLLMTAALIHIHQISKLRCEQRANVT